MRFNFSFLARISPSPFGTWDAIYVPALAIVDDAPSRPDALSRLTDELQHFISTEGVNYLRAHAGDSTRVMCPEGTIDLVADDWFCKRTSRRCPIGATLDRANLDASLSRCDAPESVKSGIPAALTDGYAGLHHTSGRYLCALCGGRKKARFRASSYRYPFELQHLMRVLELQSDDIDRHAVRRAVLNTKINLSVMSGAACADRLRKVIEQISPEFATELEIVNLSIDL